MCWSERHGSGGRQPLNRAVAGVAQLAVDLLRLVTDLGRQVRVVLERSNPPPRCSSAASRHGLAGDPARDPGLSDAKRPAGTPRRP